MQQLNREKQNKAIIRTENRLINKNRANTTKMSYTAYGCVNLFLFFNIQMKLVREIEAS